MKKIRFLGFDLTEDKNEQKRRVRVLLKEFLNTNKRLESVISCYKGLRDDTKNKTQKKEFHSRVKTLEKMILANNLYVYKTEDKLSDLMSKITVKKKG